MIENTNTQMLELQMNAESDLASKMLEVLHPTIQNAKLITEMSLCRTCLKMFAPLKFTEHTMENGGKCQTSSYICKACLDSKWD